MGTAIATRIIMMLMTIISSSKVKPRTVRSRLGGVGELVTARADGLSRHVPPNSTPSAPASVCCSEQVQPLAIYQSLYLVPSNPVPCDLVKTSNTLCPPHESESGSSCIERIPHSVLFVIGSTG